MNIVEFWQGANKCTDANCPGCLVMKALLESLAPRLPTAEALDAAAAQEDDAPMEVALDAIQKEVIACLFAAATMALFAATTNSENGRHVNKQLAGHLFTNALAKAIRAVGLPIPVAVTMPAPAEMQAALEQLAGVPNVPIKH